LAMLLDETVVVLSVLPAVDDEVAAGLLNVEKQLRADVAVARAEEGGPHPLRPVHLLEPAGVVGLVREDQCDQRIPPRSWCARKKFSLPAVAIAADALSSRHSAVAATIWASR